MGANKLAGGRSFHPSEGGRDCVPYVIEKIAGLKIKHTVDTS